MTVYVTPEGSGTVEINGVLYKSPRSVPNNSDVSFEAIPGEGYEFVNWSGALSGNENLTTLSNVTCDKTVTANFQASNDLPVVNAGDDQSLD